MKTKSTADNTGFALLLGLRLLSSFHGKYAGYSNLIFLKKFVDLFWLVVAGVKKEC